MKKISLFTVLMVAIPILLLLLSFWLGGMFDLLYITLGSMGIIGVFLFIAFILFIIYMGTKLAKKAIQPKTLANGIPATATVIRSYQGNLKISFGGVQQNYQLIIEVNVTNQQGETWPATMKEMINITQIGLFQPGASFKVLYDPNDKSKIVFDQSQQQQQSLNNSVNIPGYGIINSDMARQAAQQQPQDITMQLQANIHLINEFNTKRNGIPSPATVLSTQLFYANYLTGNDVYKLKLLVNPPTSSEFEAEVISLIAKPSLFKIDDGKTVYVQYDRNNPQRICLTGLDKPDTAIAL